MPLTRNGATQAKGKPAEPAKAKARRDARKAAVERERGLEKLVDAANLKRDPLQDLPALREFRRNGLDAELEWRRGPDLSDADMTFCAELLASNMRDQYKAAGWGWSDVAKKRALREDTTRALLVRSHGSEDDCSSSTEEETGVDTQAAAAAPACNLGFVMVQFCMEAERPTLYLLELQLTEQTRGKGLGKFLMEAVEAVAHKQRMQCVMLTVFKANVGAVRLYEKLGYVVDESSPSQCGVPDSCYEIMSKQVGADV